MKIAAIGVALLGASAHALQTGTQAQAPFELGKALEKLRSGSTAVDVQKLQFEIGRVVNHVNALGLRTYAWADENGYVKDFQDMKRHAERMGEELAKNAVAEGTDATKKTLRYLKTTSIKTKETMSLYSSFSSIITATARAEEAIGKTTEDIEHIKQGMLDESTPVAEQVELLEAAKNRLTKATLNLLQCHQSVEKLETMPETLMNNIHELKPVAIGQIDLIKQQLPKLQGDCDELQEQTGTLKAEIEELRQKLEQAMVNFPVTSEATSAAAEAADVEFEEVEEEAQKKILVNQIGLDTVQKSTVEVQESAAKVERDESIAEDGKMTEPDV